MECSSRSLNPAGAALPAVSSAAAVVRKASQAIFLWPLLLLTAFVHVLCQPLTKKVLFGLLLLIYRFGAGRIWRCAQALPNSALIEGFDFSITIIALCGL
jgi:hypothetical protein